MQLTIAGNTSEMVSSPKKKKQSSNPGNFRERYDYNCKPLYGKQPLEKSKALQEFCFQEGEQLNDEAHLGPYFQNLTKHFYLRTDNASRL